MEFLNAYAKRMSGQFEDFSLDEWKWTGYRKKKAQPLSRIEGKKVNILAQSWCCMLVFQLREHLGTDGLMCSSGCFEENAQIVNVGGKERELLRVTGGSEFIWKRQGILCCGRIQLRDDKVAG